MRAGRLSSTRLFHQVHVALREARQSRSSRKPLSSRGAHLGTDLLESAGRMPSSRRPAAILARGLEKALTSFACRPPGTLHNGVRPDRDETCVRRQLFIVLSERAVEDRPRTRLSWPDAHSHGRARQNHPMHRMDVFVSRPGRGHSLSDSSRSIFSRRPPGRHPAPADRPDHWHRLPAGFHQTTASLTGFGLEQKDCFPMRRLQA